MLYIIFSFDDSSRHTIKCAKLLSKYDLKGTFYLDTMRLEKELKIGDVKWMAEWNEIGSHSVAHRDLTRLSLSEVWIEVKKSKDTLEKILDKQVKSFAYPFGKYNGRIIEVVKSCGYSNARSTELFNMATSISNPYAIGVTFYTDPHGYRLLPKAVSRLKAKILILKPWLLKKWNLLITKFLERLRRDGGSCIHILVHPDFIEERNDWSKLENLMSFISSLSNTVNLTLSEFVDRIWKI